MRALGTGGLVCAAVLLWCATASAQLADTVFVTVQSQPDGAYITDMLKHAGGMSPQVYSYPASQFKKDDKGCIYTHGFDARWGSGAAASSTKYIRLCPSASKDQFYVVINRDPSDSGLDKDLRFAMELADRKQSAAVQAQVDKDRRENAMIEGLAEGFAGAMSARAARQPMQVAPLRCTSKRTISGSVETVCE